MRKRVSRPRRFAAVDNDAIDGLPAILGVGLLTCLIRAKDGDDVTVESLTEKYEEGEKSLSKAMRSLVEGAYVVKFKIQRATSEVVVEDGKEVVKRGGSWYTTFSVDSIPFAAKDVAAMLEEIYAEGNVKSHRVEPTRLDPNKKTADPARPTPPKGGVGATRENTGSEGAAEGQNPEDSGARPTPPSGAPGRPTPGQGGAHIRKKTSSARARENEGDAASPRSGTDGRRPSDGSSACEDKGGSAASSNDQPAPTNHDTQQKAADNGKARHTREQLAKVKAVRAYLPRELVGTGVPTLSDVILAALAEGAPEARTVEQLGARIQRRWHTHGWALKVLQGVRLKSHVGVAVDLVRPYQAGDRFGCPHPRCEDGIVLDTEEEDCTVCAERIAERKARRRQGDGQGAGKDVPGPRTATVGSKPVWWDCLGCRDPFKSPMPADGLCEACRTAPPAAENAAPTWEELSTEELAALEQAEWLALLEEAHAEHGQREQRSAEERARIQALEEQRRMEGEETDRLRAQIAAEHPELAMLSQGPPPF